MIGQVRRLVVASLVLAAAVGGAVAYGHPGPDSATQAQLDGCRRDKSAEFTRTAPEWVDVGDHAYPASGPAPPGRWVSGVAEAYGNGPDAFHPSPADDPVAHDSFDSNLNVRVDPQDTGLLGSANFEGADEESGRIHAERELAGFPSWAWPEIGDRVQLYGSWVWDCGHWQPGGERTEIHPFRVIWTERTPSPRSPTGDAEGDLFVSSDATPAGKIAECAHATKGDAAAFKACLSTQPNWLDVVGDYVLTLAAPPRPPGATHLAVRVVDRGSTVDPHWTTTLRGETLTLRFHLDATPGVRLLLERQVFLGWRPLRPSALPEHLRVTFTKLLTRRSMDGPSALESTLAGQISKPPGEWLLFTDVAGLWALWPRVLAATDGRTFALRWTTDLYVRPGAPWRLLVYPHECDFGTASFDDPSTPMAPCPRTAEFGSLVGDDMPGELVVHYRGAQLGVHAANGGTAPPSTCPPANASGCYRLWWTVTRVRDEARRARAAR